MHLVDVTFPNIITVATVAFRVFVGRGLGKFVFVNDFVWNLSSKQIFHNGPCNIMLDSQQPSSKCLIRFSGMIVCFKIGNMLWVYTVYSAQSVTNVCATFVNTMDNNIASYVPTIYTNICNM